MVTLVACYTVGLLCPYSITNRTFIIVGQWSVISMKGVPRGISLAANTEI